jgi:tRNA/tmRNA/rRNA uracil-C5-methylase (TrmA/RlmC/RlmD family)
VVTRDDDVAATPEIGALVELDVGAPGHGGFCIARLVGRAVFVRHSLPGERVRARITEVRPSYLRADAVEILSASADRVPAPCPHAGPGKCGGCDWQHVSLPAQRALKAAVVAEQFRRLAGMDVSVEVEEVTGAPDGLGWRSRVTFAVDRHGRAGLRRHRSHDVHPIGTCLIAHPLIRELHLTDRSWRGAASVEAVASSTGDRAVVVEQARGHRLQELRLEDGVTVARRVGRTLTVDAGADTVTERAAGRDWQIGVDSFWQIHPAAADTLAATVVEFAGIRAGDRVLDLYAGAGLFAGALAGTVGADGSVVAVESSPDGVRDARRNLAGESQTGDGDGDGGDGGGSAGRRVDVRRALIEPGVLPRVLRDVTDVDVVVLDPPRTGAGRGVVDDIAALGPRAVVYVACDPAALARDVATFSIHGFVMQRLRAFDLFPMTAHVECVALLVPQDNGKFRY